MCKILHKGYLSEDLKRNEPWDVAKNWDVRLKVKEYEDLLNATAIASLLEAGINPNKFIKYDIIKYENPAGAERPFFFAFVPDELAQKIYDKHGIKPTEAELEEGFWHIVLTRNLPITLVEGAKKALSILSQGEIAVGTPGVTLYRSTYKDENGDRQYLPKRELTDAIAAFATPGRQITIANDQDKKTRTIWNVRRDTVRSAELMAERGAVVKIAKWDDLYKGADDLIFKKGGKALLKAIATSQPWEHEGFIHYRAQYNRLAKYIINRHGEPDSLVKLDVAIGVLCRNEDIGRVISHSPSIRKASAAEAEAYVQEVKEKAEEFRVNWGEEVVRPRIQP